jgi:hypothetical protein
MWRRSWTRIGSAPTAPRRAATGNRRNRFPGQGVVGRCRGQRQASAVCGGPSAPWRDGARTGRPPRLPSVPSQSDSAVSSARDGQTVREPRPRRGRVPGFGALPPACCRCFPPRSAGCTGSSWSPRTTRGATSIQADRSGFDPRRLLPPATPQVTARERLRRGDGIRYSPWSCSPREQPWEQPPCRAARCSGGSAPDREIGIGTCDAGPSEGCSGRSDR